MCSLKNLENFLCILFLGYCLALVLNMRYEYETWSMEKGRRDIRYLFYDQPKVPPTQALMRKNPELEYYHQILVFYRRQGTGKRRNLNTNYERPGRMPQPARHLEPVIRLQYMAESREWPTLTCGHEMQKPNSIWWSSIFVLISNLPRLVVYNDIDA